MRWYGRDWDFPAYVSVGEKRARAARTLATLGKKNGRAPEPVVIASRGRAIATTFWGKAWCDNLERYMDFANRLPRGRSYVRNGAVVDLAITSGAVQARVAGSRLYAVKIGIAAMARPRWRAVVARCTGKIGSLVGLLRGELSGDAVAVLADSKQGLFPEPREITMDCSCPDWAAMCKHVAAVLYGVGARLDQKPELFFTLRQVDQAELVSAATAGAVSRARAGAAGKRVAAGKLAEVFGIDLEDEAPEPAPPAARKRAPAPPSARRARRPSSSNGTRGARSSRQELSARSNAHRGASRPHRRNGR